MTKTLILINGCMGVGKTAVAQAVHRRLHRSAWLDGDWCWMMNPWVMTDLPVSEAVEGILRLVDAGGADGA